MSENDGRTFITAFVAGAAIGAGAALLFAPRSGEEIRDKIREWGEQARESVENQKLGFTQRIRDLRIDIERLTSQTFETGQQRVTSELEALRTALDEGLRVLREEREKRSRPSPESPMEEEAMAGSGQGEGTFEEL